MSSSLLSFFMASSLCDWRSRSIGRQGALSSEGGSRARSIRRSGGICGELLTSTRRSSSRLQKRTAQLVFVAHSMAHWDGNDCCQHTRSLWPGALPWTRLWPLVCVAPRTRASSGQTRYASSGTSSSTTCSPRASARCRRRPWLGNQPSRRPDGGGLAELMKLS